MAKDVEFLLLSKSETNTKTKNTSENLTKKEGLSLFDSLLLAGQKEKKDNNLENKITKKNVTSEKDITNEFKQVPKDKITQNKLIDITQDTKVKNSTLEEKNEIAKENKLRTTSLLDKLILEAKKNVKTVNSKELTSLKDSFNKVIDNNEPSKIQTNKKDTISLLDQIIAEAKKELVKNSENTLKELNIKGKENLIEKIKEAKQVNTNINIEKQLDNNSLETHKTEITALKKEQKSLDTKITINKEIVSLDDEEIKTSLKDLAVEKKVVSLNEEEIKTSLKDLTVEKELKNSELNNISKKQKLEPDNQIIASKKDIQDNSKDLLKVEKDLETKNIDQRVFNKNIEKNIGETNNEFQSESKQEKSIADNKNEKNSLKDFSKLDAKAIVKEEQRVNISKDTLMKDEVKNNMSETKSFIDKLVDDTKKSNINKETLVDKNITSKQQTSYKSNDIVTNIFLSSQKNSIYRQILANKSEGVKVVNEAKTLEAVKKGASILDLGLKEVFAETEVRNEVKISLKNEKDTLMDKLIFERNIKDDKINNKNFLQQQMTSNISNVSSSASIATTDVNIVNLNVNPDLAMSIQSRIIGAQQQMSSMLSDVARNMYENYKPPITAFRINLFPAQLGHIAILMKNDKENSINISLNISNANTLDAFIEGQSILKEALNKNFNNEQTSFNLDFNKQDENSNNQSSQDDEKQKEKSKQNLTSNEILEAINENQDIDKDLNYL